MTVDKERVYDAYLVASARIGDRTALARLVQRWQPRFIGHAYRMLGNADLAAEAAQEAWLEVLRGIAGLDDAKAFPAWALRIVGRRCARLIKGRQRAREVDRTFVQEQEAFFEGTDNGELRVELAAVQKALATLSPEQQVVIGLFYLEEMSVAEVSIVLEIPPGTVKTRLMHARQKLRAQLEGDFDEQN